VYFASVAFGAAKDWSNDKRSVTLSYTQAGRRRGSRQLTLATAATLRSADRPQTDSDTVSDSKGRLIYSLQRAEPIYLYSVPVPVGTGVL